ncbi:MAG TPA: protein-glutamate O-methyltransferase CheR [Cyclobacteriaceae bacterium]
MTAIQEISEEEIKALTQSILTRYGIDFTCYEPKSLRRRIIRVLNRFNLESAFELWGQFLKDKEFVHVFMNEISVGMTSMFRDPVLWRRLKTRMPKEYSTKDKLSVWHAGCSTGEEVYSMGIVLKETNLIEKTTAKATDFNKDAIEEAKKGVYHKIKMIENETNYKEVNPFYDFSNYYTTDGKHAMMNPELINHANFSYQNLITDPFPQGFDIIFCRNVMIYFDNIAKARLLEKFHNALNPGGYLIIGFFDTMIHLMDNKKFELADEEAKIFKKIE